MVVMKMSPKSIILFGLLSAAICLSEAVVHARPATAGGARVSRGAAEARAKTEWLIDQKETVIYMTRDQVRVHNKANDYDCVCQAPDYTVHCFRKDKKMMWRSKLSEFSATILLRPFATDTDLRAPARYIGKMVHNGIPCEVYQGAYSRHLGSSEIKAEPKIIEFLNRYLFTAYIPSVPLFTLERKSNPASKYKQRDWLDDKQFQNFSTRIGLSTDSLVKKKYDAHDFDVPTGYKMTTHVKSISFSPKNQAQVESFLDGVGFTTDR